MRPASTNDPESNERRHRLPWVRSVASKPHGFIYRWFRKLRVVTGLHSGADIAATVGRIRNGVKLRGANLWILLCAAILASIGLNTSSAAVIIGAMLISPLMGPILGIGLGIAIHDRVMLLRALRTFGAAVAVSLAASTLYFLISPIALPTPELLARTSPTLLDVGIAFFGGVAGIIAGSRRESTTAIPGVAIATALMPPLCTAGYGLAHGHWIYFWGALYLFTLNAVFISLATFLIVRLLGIPFVTYIDPAVERRVTRWIAVIAIVAIVPSVFLFYRTIGDLQHRSAADRFVRQHLEVEGRKAVSWNLESSDTADLLKVYLAGPPMPDDEIDSLSRMLPRFGLDRSHLRVVQLNVPVMSETHVDPQELLSALRSAELQEELARSMAASSSLRSHGRDSIPIESIRQEMLAAFPSLVEIEHAEQLYRRRDTTAEATISSDTTARPARTRDTTAPIHLFFIQQAISVSEPARRDALVRMQRVLGFRLEPDSVRVLEVIGTDRVRSKPDTHQQ